MGDKASHITNALSALEELYVEHKEKFEKWKVDNIKQCGTDTYNKYVEQFNNWELGVREQQRRLIDERNSIPTPDIDAKLDEMLARLSPSDFIKAIVMMTSMDATFFPYLLSCLQKIQAYGEARQASIYQAYATAYAPSASQYTQQQYVPTVAAPTVGHPYASVRSDVPIESSNKRIFDRITEVGSASSREEPMRKYRAPSPSLDYRNPSTLPFRDFSQA